MGNFHHGANRNYGRDNRGGERRDDRRSEPKEMHRAVCSECGNNCEVPFRPSNDKPVFCNDCFSAKRDQRDAREHGGSKERYVSTPRKPEAARPVVSVNNEETKKQFSEILNRLDKLTQVIEMSFAKKEEVAEVTKPVEVKKVVAKKKTSK